VLGVYVAGLHSRDSPCASVEQRWDATSVCVRGRHMCAWWQEEFLASWTDHKLDAVLCPPNALPAFTHGSSADLTPACSYTFIYNLLHYVRVASCSSLAARVSRGQWWHWAGCWDGCV
jgi:hypothetical protein